MSVEISNEAKLRTAERFVTAMNNTREVTRFDRDTLAIVEAKVVELGELIEQVAPTGRLKSLALTHLEETLTWANKAIYTQGAQI